MFMLSWELTIRLLIQRNVYLHHKDNAMWLKKVFCLLLVCVTVNAQAFDAVKLIKLFLIFCKAGFLISVRILGIHFCLLYLLMKLTKKAFMLRELNLLILSRLLYPVIFIWMFWSTKAGHIYFGQLIVNWRHIIVARM